MERLFCDCTLTRGAINLETGEFPLTLFTNGEASDRHIVDIRGLEYSDRIPMFRNHIADPAEQLGSIGDLLKVGKSTRLGGASLKGSGRMNLEGDGAWADIRRDIAQGISVGDITGMSGRWDPIGEPVARSQLDKSHYAYHEDMGGFYTPMYFPRSSVVEGSVVGVPADAAALVGRSKDSGRPEHVRAFWRSFAGIEPMPELEPDVETRVARELVSDVVEDLFSDEAKEALRFSVKAPEAGSPDGGQAVPVTHRENASVDVVSTLETFAESIRSGDDGSAMAHRVRDLLREFGWVA